MSENYLVHHGTKGMKWGQRNYQNSDGSLTALGRIHYGVGKAKDAIRKKIAPTNAELNAQIRKQKSKNLNKQKREQLKQLKKGVDVDAQNKQVDTKDQHKRFSEMSDADIEKRINRLKSEVRLAELEATKSFGPGKRFLYEVARDAGKQALTNIVRDSLTDQGKRIVKEAFEKDTDQGKKKDYEDELAMRKAKEELKDYKKSHPEGLAKYTRAGKKAIADRKAKEAQEKADEELEKEAKRAQNRKKVYEAESARKKAEGAENSGGKKNDDSAVEADSYEVPKKKKKKKKVSSKKEQTVYAQVYRTWNANDSSSTALAVRRR